MNSVNGSAGRGTLAASLIILLAAGCNSGAWRPYFKTPPMVSLGSQSDAIWQNQEANAEMSDFVVHQHEFQKDTEWLNTGGEDHVKQVATRLLAGQDAQVVVERSMASARLDTQHQYPVHPNPELDMRRREIIVRSLTAMGIADADERVVVAPAFAQGFTGSEAEAAYYSGMSGSGFGGGMGSTSGFGGFMFGGGY
jgi:hypothetical protein